MSTEDRSSHVPADSGASESLPLLPAKFSASDAANGGTSEERRRLIRKIIVGVPAVVAMTARGATAQNGGGDILAASAPSTPSN